MYNLNVFRFLFSIDYSINRLKEAEKIKKLWKVSSLLILASIVIYGWMAYLGVGSNIILSSGRKFSPDVYESSKFWFIIGRMMFGALYAIFILFIPALIFKWLTNIEFSRLLTMQLVVLLVALVERLTWIPIVVLAGLDIHVSPFSFGIIASYVTSQAWLIYFFGAISIFQLWIIWFQVKLINSFIDVKKVLIWISVIVLHIVGWWLIAIIIFMSPLVIGRWFG